MRRLSQDEGQRVAARIADEHGFTLVELLVTMVIAIVVIGAGTYGLAQAFEHSNQITSRSGSANQAEVGIQRLTQDLRYSVACPTYSSTNGLGAGGQYVNGLLVSTGPEIQLCEQLPSATAGQAPPLGLVSWVCNTAKAAQMCTRNVVALYCPPGGASANSTPAVGNCTTGAPTAGVSVTGSTTSTVPAAGSNAIYGVSSVTFSGLVGGTSSGTENTLSSDTACQTTSAGLPYESYGLTTGASCPLSWVRVQFTLLPQTLPNNPSDPSNIVLQNQTQAVQLQTATALENFGT